MFKSKPRLFKSARLQHECMPIEVFTADQFMNQANLRHEKIKALSIVTRHDHNEKDCPQPEQHIENAQK